MGVRWPITAVEEGYCHISWNVQSMIMRFVTVGDVNG